ncbi:hypothetical protein G6F40_015335 [Rhizopus arrhizus]|nr:hypothetical protein G6F40_015335 [Rhizopus arrhizus]
MRLEGHDGGRQAALASDLADARQHGLVPAMDAVEIADRQRARGAPVGRRQGSGDAQRWFHEREFTILDSGFVLIPPTISARPVFPGCAMAADKPFCDKQGTPAGRPGGYIFGFFYLAGNTIF